jgi:hypothetical protein
MRQGPNPKRSRGRNNNNNSNNNNNGRRPNMPMRMQTFDSNGPDVRIRGSAFQVHEKYLQLARDASSSGDRIMAESYLQHAEHYYRIIAAAQEQQQQNGGGDPNRRYRPEGGFGQDYRGSGEDGNGDGGDDFSGDESADGQTPRGEGNYRPQQTEQYSRQQGDGQYRNQDGQGQYRQDQDGQLRDSQPRDGQQPRQDGEQRPDRDGGQGREGQQARDSQTRDYRQQNDGNRNPSGEARPARNFDNRRDNRRDGNRDNNRDVGYENRQQASEPQMSGAHANGMNGDAASAPAQAAPIHVSSPLEIPIEPMLDVAQPVAAAEETPAAPRRGRPRKPRVAIDAVGVDPATEG